MKLAKRGGVAVIIATLIMIAAAVLFTSIMLYWGQAYLGQSTTNLGSAIFRSNNAAAEDISIDGVLFVKGGSGLCVGSGYCVTVYVRNFGDTPVRIAGIHIANLQSVVSQAFDCEVTTNPPAVTHMVIVARKMNVVNLSNNCSTTGLLLPPSWASNSISIQVSSEAGTKYQNNYSLPP